MSSLGNGPEELVVGPNVGEDSAVLRTKDGYQVIASDPVTGATKNIGYHAVYVNANDIAATGADPRYMTAIILLGKNSSEAELKDIMYQINRACEDVGAFVIGGHTEMVANLDINIICGTMIGWTDRYIPTSGARPGENILLTKGAGIEGTSILAHEREEELSANLGTELIEKAKGYSKMLSIIPEARLIRDLATSMHDPTEGGIAGALNEMAMASGHGFDVDISKIPVSMETKEICSYFAIDPLNLISSGTLMATIPDENKEKATSILRNASIPFSFIGKMTREGTNIEMPQMDALWEII
jgi:hydrogenase maturation factor